MSRIHLFELEDQSWLPQVIRDAGTAYLEFASILAKHGETVAPLLSESLHRASEDRIVDLCSGGSGPLPVSLRAIEQSEERIVTATLTDLYPNTSAFEKITTNNAAISARYEPIDATAVPKDLPGLRTLFNGFHHFRPALAKRILQNAVGDRSPITIVEFVSRHPLSLLGMLFAPLVSLFVIPFLRPFRWSWIPLTYFVPIIPLFIGWDGFVSCLRCYNQEELRQMTAEVASPDYDWEVGELDMPGAPFNGSFVIGTPREPAE
jgi:hypothetical protein